MGLKNGELTRDCMNGVYVSRGPQLFIEIRRYLWWLFHDRFAILIGLMRSQPVRFCSHRSVDLGSEYCCCNSCKVFHQTENVLFSPIGVLYLQFFFTSSGSCLILV